MMGSAPPKSYRLKSYQQFIDLISLSNIDNYIATHQQIPHDLLNRISIIHIEDKSRQFYNEIFHQMRQANNFQPQYLAFESKQTQRCVASLLGLGICDALGASTQFIPYDPTGLAIIKDGFDDIIKAIQCKILEPRSGTVGIWTDDCSMALCMATSLIFNKGKFVPKHIRYLFILWILNGLNNGGRNHSIGLGGNIKISMQQFMRHPSDYCKQGTRFNNGNGSLMRLAPIPIAFRNNIQNALEVSGLSSLTTHNGLQAQHCCKLLAYILVKLYKRKQDEDPKKVLQQACDSFIPECQSVYFLSKSTQQSKQLYEKTIKQYGKHFLEHNAYIEDRNWDWKSKNYQYSKTRAFDKPGYVGSYCMDALAMALHTVWNTNNFKECAIMNANLGGDSDTVGAIAGQIAGAMYGIDENMLRLYSEMVDFKSGNYELFLHGLKLAQL